LSPFLFAVYVDDLIERLRKSQCYWTDYLCLFSKYGLYLCPWHTYQKPKPDSGTRNLASGIKNWY